MLPEELKQQAMLRARMEGISLGELIRQSLAAALEEDAEDHRDDPLFADAAVYRGAVPSDIAADHDHYLYEQEP
jgi:hexokinase